MLWAHVPGVDLVHLTSEGRIKFLDPRYGRVKAFPNQGSEGNYSISIDELQNSDMGCYRCKEAARCLQVELVAEIGKKISIWKFKGSTEQYWAEACADMWPLPFHGHTSRGRKTQKRTCELARASCQTHLVKTTTCHAGTQSKMIPLLIYICICVAALILLSVCSYFGMKCICEYA